MTSELLVATLLGGLVLTAAWSLLHEQRQSYRDAVETVELLDRGSDALALIGHYVREAGDRCDTAAPATGVAPAAGVVPHRRVATAAGGDGSPSATGVDAGLRATGVDAGPPAGVFGCVGAKAGGSVSTQQCEPLPYSSDGLEVRHCAPARGVAAEFAGTWRDCLGHNVRVVPGERSFVVARFHVDRPRGSPEVALRCTGNATDAAQPMVWGIETLKVQYLLKGDHLGRSSVAFSAPVPACPTVSAREAEQAGWGAVTGVAVCVVVRGTRTRDVSTFTDCGGMRRVLRNSPRRVAMHGFFALRNGPTR